MKKETSLIILFVAFLVALGVIYFASVSFREEMASQTNTQPIFINRESALPKSEELILSEDEQTSAAFDASIQNEMGVLDEEMDSLDDIEMDLSDFDEGLEL